MSGFFAGRTAFITGASRGIGKEIGLKLANDDANIEIAAETAIPNPKLAGTVYSEEIEKAGGKALPLVLDVRDEKNVQKCGKKAADTFGGIDILINNASAIILTGTERTDMKRYGVMHSINTRGTFLTSKTCIPYLRKGKNPHILNLSPPLLMDKICSLHMSDTLCPTIWTAAMEMLTEGKGMSGARSAAMLSKESTKYTGNFGIDEEILREEGVTDFDKYAMVPNAPLVPTSSFLEVHITIDGRLRNERRFIVPLVHYSIHSPYGRFIFNCKFFVIE